MVVIYISEAVAQILDSLDDIEILQESSRLTPLEILSAVDDYWLRRILEVNDNGIHGKLIIHKNLS